MKIIAIEAIPLALPLRKSDVRPAKLATHADMVLVRVRTDDGLVGWGEIFALGGTWRAACTALDRTIAPRCIGRDPLQLNALSRDVLYAIHQLGRGGSVMQAWSGLEIALWDLQGKALGVPLHRLFGGAQVPRLAAYASLPRYGDERMVRVQTERSLAQGLHGVKLHETDPALVHAAWQVAGPAQAELMLDVNADWNEAQAHEAVRRMAGVPLRWLEEPLAPADDYAALARLRAACEVPIAAGECASSPSDFHHAIRLQALDVLQPSPSKLGGIAATRRVLELAADTALEVALHTPQYGPALLASLQLCAALAPQAPQEHFVLDLAASPYGDAVWPRDGGYAVPQGPGLGAEPDEDVIAHCRID